MKTGKNNGLISTIKVLFSTILIFLFVTLYLCCVIWLIQLGCSRLFNIFEHPVLLATAELIALLICAFPISFITTQKSDRREMKFIKKLATFPNKHNYNWQGGYSLIVFILLHTITLFRITSCLQLGKHVYRTFLANSKDIVAKRSNVPPVFQELYFLFWMCFIYAQLFFNISNPLIFALNVYFITESLTWILYYSVFRRFFEEKYSIYHVLEHLPLILLLIPSQAVAYAKIVSFKNPDIGWRDILIVLLGEAESHQILFSIIGFLYSAIVISMILSMFPTENIKTGNPKTIIVGAGEVVKKRLLPAILRRFTRIKPNRRGTISIYDLKDGIYVSSWKKTSDLWEQLGLPQTAKTESIYSLVKEPNYGDDVVAWICSPSNTHLYYLELLHAKCSFVAVEKPLTSLEDEIGKFKDYAQSEYRDKTFFLSYYLLEKGLPITFLCRPKAFYTNYLAGFDNEGNQLSNKEESQQVIESFYKTYLESGQVTKFTMKIIEGKDKRTLPDGGQLVETFIHNCIIASLFTGLPEYWTECEFNSNQIDHIDMNAIGRNQSKIHLVLSKKEGNVEEQTAVIKLEHAMLTADFKAKTATITANNKTFTIGIKDIYKGKYDVQCSMVYDCYNNGINTSEVDGLYNQIECLEWLMEKNAEHKRKNDLKANA